MFWHNFIPSPVIFSFGPLTFHWYGLFFGLGILVAYWVTVWQDQKNLKLDRFLEKVFIWLLLGGLIGARLLDVFYFEWWYFKNNLLQIPLFWQGGLAWQGGLIGGLVVVLIFVVRHQIDLRGLLDLLAPGLALGQAVGRWGNYFNQELFGRPTNWPWGIPIEPMLRPVGWQDFIYFQPVFLYEFLGLLFIGLFLLFGFKKWQGNGRLLAWYLLLSGSLRLGLEFIRLDIQPVWLGLRAGGWLALLMAIIGLIWLIKLTWFTNKLSKSS